MNEETIDNILSLYIGRCGHQWVGATSGSYGCPVCGLHDGDHHLVSVDEITVQPDDFGCAWEQLAALAEKRRKKQHEQYDQAERDAVADFGDH